VQSDQKQPSDLEVKSRVLKNHPLKASSSSTPRLILKLAVGFRFAPVRRVNFPLSAPQNTSMKIAAEFIRKLGRNQRAGVQRITESNRKSQDKSSTDTGRQRGINSRVWIAMNHCGNTTSITGMLTTMPPKKMRSYSM